MRRYTKDHCWVDIQGNRARVGLSDFAQSELGEIAYVQLPREGLAVARGDVVGTVDSLKSSSEIYAPVSGTVVEVNSELGSEKNASLVNRDPLGKGWLVVIEMNNPGEASDLLAEEEYLAYTRGP
ncbi:MAG TPA: glycine cleavage system protein GcvH [Spirochaetia bacterium]|nr:glycine cleavage system protein GcvH [Spirochaetia bacterium]